ncbi:hypothetical protein Fcan01_15018 [Folsomia candida]|uniref:Uncharacterized protein n=1 Tax=Folsomia candida TaxID=158441 RepID=A0A226E0I4_FOLCA|nr:hypothetical protein Fcan01_15018 [Folsomia candida]
MGLTSGISAIDGARVGEATLDLICSLIALLWAYLTRDDDDEDNDDTNNNGANAAIEQAPNPQEQAEGNAPDNKQPEIEPPPPPLPPPQPDEEDKQPGDKENASDNVTEQPEIEPPPPPQQPEKEEKQPVEEETTSDDSDDDEPIFCPGLTHPDHVFPRTCSSPPPLRRRKQQEGDGFMRKFRSLFRSPGKFEIDPEDPFRPTSAMEDAMSTLKHFAMASIFTVGSEREQGGSGVPAGRESSPPTDDGESNAVAGDGTPAPQMYPCTDETDSMGTQEPGCSSASVPTDGQESAGLITGEIRSSAETEESNLDKENNSIPTTASNSVAEIGPQTTSQGVITPRGFCDVNPLDSSPSRPHTAGGQNPSPLGDAEVPSTSRQIHSAPGNAPRILIPSSTVSSTSEVGSVIPPVDVDVRPSSSHVLDQLGLL